ncbi:MAG TPA: isoprenylcysteine carboxylmethyltransferase family protein [Candidatus Cybelea sp.]|nr:isoprenylcysteine carboxylmethyltransferase family protein [Candidatus Cybelea sp.]
MAVYRTALAALWLIFIVVWVVAAFSAKKNVGVRSWSREAGLRFIIFALVLMLLRIPILRNAVQHGRAHLLTVDPRLALLGLILCALGVALAIWARVYLGSNWGLPMSHKAQPELVTTGPYAFVRHPIYSGLLLAILGSALAESYVWLIPLVVAGGYFLYSARAEERLMTETFPDQYPVYQKHTKMLVPFIL